MKNLLFTASAALSAVFLTVAVTPAQASPLGLGTSMANDISATSTLVTKAKKRGRGYHRRYRNRGYYRGRGYRRYGYGLSLGFGTYFPSYYGRRSYYPSYPSYYYDRYDYAPSYSYEPDYEYAPSYEYGNEYRGDSKAADRIFKQQEQDGP